MRVSNSNKQQESVAPCRAAGVRAWPFAQSFTRRVEFTAGFRFESAESKTTIHKLEI